MIKIASGQPTLGPATDNNHLHTHKHTRYVGFVRSAAILPDAQKAARSFMHMCESFLTQGWATVSTTGHMGHHTVSGRSYFTHNNKIIRTTVLLCIHEL